MTRNLRPLAMCVLLLCLLHGRAFSAAQEEGISPVHVPDASVWRTPPIRPAGFQFEIQISSLGACYDRERVEASIEGHHLGGHDSAVSKTMAAEWGYSFTHLDGQVDGAGRHIEAGYKTPPADRAACLPVIEAFLHRQYLRGAPHPWSSMNGHFPWHHYAAKFGFDQLGSEIGENINNYQWHIALNRGAARQYGRPWFIDFSAWHGPGINDYSGCNIWGEYSHPDHGHSMSLFERSLYVSYMAGAGQITVEAGGALAFLTEVHDDGLYALSPQGKVCKRFRDFSLAYPEVGIPWTPFGIVLDFYHGAYPGFGPRKAFGHFDYNAGDNMTWDLINLVWPGGWEVMGKDEVGTLVNGPYGDTFDILLQNAPQKVLNSYPCLVLSGDVKLSGEEAARFRAYVAQGGTLMLNSAYLGQFPEFAFSHNTENAPVTKSFGQGLVIRFGPDYSVAQLDSIMREALLKRLPLRITGEVQFLINLRDDALLVTLVNNAGVTKAPRAKPVIDPTKGRTVTIAWTGDGQVESARELRKDRNLPMDAQGAFTVSIPPGEVVIVELVAPARIPHP